MSHFHKLILLFVSLSISFGAGAREFVDFGPAPEFLEVSVHALGGSSMITENYMGCFSEITEMNTSGGLTVGGGITAVFGIKDWLGIGTELNLLSQRYRADMAVSNDDATSISNIFLKNSTTVANIPIYMQFRFNVASGVRWTVDAGLYYSYGLHGRQKQSIYSSQVNSMGQLVNNRLTSKVHYYNSQSTFINTYHRSDIGFHLATGLQFSRKISVGARIDIGLKNVAHIKGNAGIVCPNIHNIGYSFTIGYRL